MLLEPVQNAVAFGFAGIVTLNAQRSVVNEEIRVQTLTTRATHGNEQRYKALHTEVPQSKH